MKITAISGILALLCSTVYGQIDVSDLPTITKRPIITGEPITRITFPPLSTVKPPIDTCTRTVTIFQTIIPPPATLPIITLTVTLTVTVTNTTTTTTTLPCTTTANPCPNPCEVTKTVDDCKTDSNCIQTISTTTVGCKCPETKCTGPRVVITTCLTCPPLGIKTVPCSTESPITR